MTEPVRRVAVTGAAGYLGNGLIRRLDEDDEVEAVLAIDVRSMSRKTSAKVTFVRQDITESIASAFSKHGIDAVVHLAFRLNPGRDRKASWRTNVSGAARVFESCVEAGVRHIVYLSSTTVYGARADNPPELTEDSPLRPVSGFTYGEDKATAEGLLSDLLAEQPGITATVLRACPVMGPTADNFIAQAFSKPFLVGIRGHDPELQLCHEDDLAEVLLVCAINRAPGVYNLAGSETVRWSEMVNMFGRRLVSLPAWAVYPLTELTWRLRIQNESPAVGLDFIRYPWTVSTDKLRRELGIVPVHSSREAWESFALRNQPVPARGPNT
ncbi:MAG: NAD-dependent epimerase/dehydratase family protein [Chloroflexi bacterium]|nr:NAD-dependent epimerase/dehydratase family protein [Chloroflexota bacterium]